jgi:hypothetical protein
MVIIRWLEGGEVGFSLDLREDLCSHGIVATIAKDEMLIWHIEESIYDEIDSLGWRETSEGEKVRSFTVSQFYSFTGWLSFCHTIRRKSPNIRRRIDNLALISTIREESIMHILWIGDDRIHTSEEVDVFSGFAVEDEIRERMEPCRDPLQIVSTQVEYIAWRSMTVVYFLSICSTVAHRFETIPWKYHNIVLTQESSLMDESISEDLVPESLGKNRAPECDHLALESELAWIKTPIREKPRDQVCTDRLRHERYESLSPTTIEECIMEDGDLGFFVSHAKRILKKGEKTIEFGRFIKIPNAK